MSYQVTILSILIGAIVIQAKQLDSGPQIFPNINNSSMAGEVQNQQKRFATKEMIVYLTPSQIQDLHAGKAELQSQPSGEISIIEVPYQEKFSHQNLASTLDILKSQHIHKPPFDDKEQENEQDKYNNLPIGLKINNAEAPHKFVYQESKPELPKFHRVHHQVNNNNEWSDIRPITEKNLDDQPIEEYNRQWQNNKNNYEQIKLVSDIPKHPEEQQKYIPNYSPLLALAHNKFQQQNNEIEKQRALAQADAIAKSSPVIIHKEVKITKHKQVPVVQHVEVPVPTPVLVPVLHPYEVKVPQPYPVPVEVIKHIPVSIQKREKSPAEKSVSLDGNKYHPARNVYIQVDSPSYQIWKH